MKATSHNQIRKFTSPYFLRLIVVLQMGAFGTTVFTTSICAEDVFTGIDFGQVKVGGVIGERIDKTIKNNVLPIDIDHDFLNPFRKKNLETGFIGLGMHLDSLVHFAVYSQNDQLLILKKHVVAEIIKTQDSDGYIGILKPESRIWKLWDVHEMSYLIHGLTADYRYFDEAPSLKAAREVADYIIRRWAEEPDRHPSDKRPQGRVADQLSVLGIGTAMLSLYEQTHDKRYLEFCTTFLAIPQWKDPIVLGRKEPVAGQATAFLSRSLAQLLINRINPDEKLLHQSRVAYDFLTSHNGLVITGGCGIHECWHDTQIGTGKLAETCTSAYIIRWLENWLCFEGETQYGDIIERTIYNTLFAAQSPDGRNLRYYTPFEGARKFYHIDTYCCTNNFRRIVSELPRMIYYQSKDGVMINLYTASTANIQLNNDVLLELRQQTTYPRSGKVMIQVDPSQPKLFSIKLRIPRWCAKATISINGKHHSSEKPGLATISREWRIGDRIELNMPMPWRLVKGRAAQQGRVAVMRGPVLFCLNNKQDTELTKDDLKNIAIISSSLTQLVSDDLDSKGEFATCQVQAWIADKKNPAKKKKLNLRLTEFPAPDGVAVYFKASNSSAELIVEDELIKP